MEKKVTPKDKFLKEAKEDPDFKSFPTKFRLQLYTLKRCYGNVSKAANVLGISRQCFYKNCEEHPEYKEAFELIKNIAHDFVDDALMEQIKEGDTNAIIWYDKTRGRHRDLGTKLNIDHTTLGNKIEQPQQLIFMSAEQMTPDEIEKYKSQYLHQPDADSND